MSTYDETKRMIKARDKMLRDAYCGRGGLSMSADERRRYEMELESAKAAREGMARSLAAIARRVG